MNEIKYERFLECHLQYLDRYRRAERNFKARRDDLIRSLDSLISHPITGKIFKSQLLEVRRTI
jgi:hypothetical protein